MILDPTKLVLFAGAALALVITPGPAVFYIVTRSVDQGCRAGMASVLGIGLGNYLQALAAALGLSAVLASSALAFSVVKYAGAMYLVFIGVKKLLSPAAEFAEAAPERRARFGAIFRQAIVVEVLNPKTALFFLAFLPQFTDPARGAVWLQLLVLGSLVSTLGVVTDSGYAMLSGTFGSWLKRRKTFARAEKYVSGTVYCGLGVATAFSGSGKST